MVLVPKILRKIGNGPRYNFVLIQNIPLYFRK